MIDIIYTLYAKNINRLAYFMVSYESLKRKGNFGNYNHKYHLCIEDGSLFIDELVNYCRKNDILVHFKINKPGLANMMNFANETGYYPYIMLMQDDWFLLKNYDFAKSIFLLENCKEYSMVRLNDDNRTGKLLCGAGGFRELDPKAPGYYYSDNPHIKERRYHKYTGPYRHIEGEHGAVCENLMNGDAIRISDEHKIVGISEHIFEHLGVEQTVLKEVD